MQIQDKLFIAGRFVPAADGATLPSLNPHDCSHLADVAMAGKADVDAAVEAAHDAFPAWSRTSAAERGRLLYKLADRIEASAEELSRLETLDTGHPIRDTRGADVPRTVATFRYFGGTTCCASRSASSVRWFPGTSRSCSRAGRWGRRWPPGTAWS